MDLNIPICPLCGQAAHPGKCPKEPKGLWWCGLCLSSHPRLETPAPAPAAQGPGGTGTSAGGSTPPTTAPVPGPILLAAGIRRTSKWCIRCGSPVCEEHADMSTPYRRYRPSCRAPDCRDRTEAELVRLIRLLEVYVPDFRTAGPPRCTVCSLPTWRRNLCARHYVHVREGRPELKPERLRPRHRDHVATMVLYPPKFLLKEAQALAAESGYSFNAWVIEVIRFMVEEKLRVNLWLKPTVFREP